MRRKILRLIFCYSALGPIGPLSIFAVEKTYQAQLNTGLLKVFIAHTCNQMAGRDRSHFSTRIIKRVSLMAHPHTVIT